MAAKTIEQELLALENEYWQAIQDRNPDPVMRLTDDPCIVTGPSGVRRLRPRDLAGMMDVPSFTLHKFHINDDAQVQLLSEDVAVLAYNVHEDATVGGTRVTLDAADASTWRRRDGRWVCALHTESLKGDPWGRDRRTNMNRLHFSIDVGAPREKVWKVLWDDATYREWTSVFSEGSYAVSDWNEGSTIQFLDPASRSGMSAIIEKKRPDEFMSFRHEAEIKNGQVQPPTGWSGAHENYTLTTNGAGTILTVDLDAPDEHRQMFESTFPQALQRVKRLSETA